MYDYITIVIAIGEEVSEKDLRTLRKNRQVTVSKEIIASGPGPRPVNEHDMYYRHAYEHFGPFSALYLLTRIGEGVTLFHIIPAVKHSNVFIRIVGSFVYCFEQKDQTEGMFFVMKKRAFLNQFKDEEIYMRSHIARMTNPDGTKRISFVVNPIKISFAKAQELMNWDGKKPPKEKEVF